MYDERRDCKVQDNAFGKFNFMKYCLQKIKLWNFNSIDVNNN